MLAANAGTAKERDIISAKDKQRKIFANSFHDRVCSFRFLSFESFAAGRDASYCMGLTSVQSNFFNQYRFF